MFRSAILGCGGRSKGHIVTRPALRAEPLTIAAEHGIPVVIVEKPIAVDAEDYLAIRRLNRSSSTKFVVNHRLRFHPKRMELQREVEEDRRGS